MLGPHARWKKVLTDTKRATPHPVSGSSRIAQKAVAIALSRSWISLVEPTPPAFRSALVKVDQFIATATTIAVAVRAKARRKPRAHSSPTRTTIPNASHTARV
ncbi:hypothetical protein NJ76_20375 [Rhodococcus sp. IITR03]|nr:hypothetical protein NJ76_20375 [Rhodococcus sp. IITR03]